MKLWGSRSLTKQLSEGHGFSGGALGRFGPRDLRSEVENDRNPNMLASTLASAHSDQKSETPSILFLRASGVGLSTCICKRRIPPVKLAWQEVMAETRNTLRFKCTWQKERDSKTWKKCGQCWVCWFFDPKLTHAWSLCRIECNLEPVKQNPRCSTLAAKQPEFRLGKNANHGGLHLVKLLASVNTSNYTSLTLSAPSRVALFCGSIEQQPIILTFMCS